MHITIFTYGPIRSRDKFKTLYLHYHNGYGHQIDKSSGTLLGTLQKNLLDHSLR